jgi:hypothetical protein
LPNAQASTRSVVEPRIVMVPSVPTPRRRCLIVSGRHDNKTIPRSSGVQPVKADIAALPFVRSMYIRNPVLTRRKLSFALSLLVCLMAADGPVANSPAQAQTAQAPAAPAPVTAAPAPQTPAAQAPSAPAADATTDAQPPEEPIGNVATLVGTATVTRNNAATPLRLKDDIYLNDVVQTAAKSSLGITFNDATTFNLTANSQITIDTYVYEDGGKQNAALFDVAKGTVAFVAAAVAKTGDMKISTPTATLGIRGTTGLVEVPEGTTAGSKNNVAIKLYPDADGKVGRIEVNDRAGARLGFLTQASSGFAIRPGAVGGAGMRFAAVPLVILPQQMLRDQGFVRQVYSTQNLGRQVVLQQREFRRANPNFINPNRPIRQPQPGQQRQNGIPGQNQPGPSGAPNRQGQQPGSPTQPGATPRTGQPQQPATTPRSGQPQRPGVPAQPGTTPRTGQPQQPGTTPRAGQPQRPGTPTPPSTTPRTDQPQQPGSPTQPGTTPRTGQPQGPGSPTSPRAAQPQQNGAPSQPSLPPSGAPYQPGPSQGQPGLNRLGVPGAPGLQRIPGLQGAPAAQRPGLPAGSMKRPAGGPPKGKPPPKEKKR